MRRLARLLPVVVFACACSFADGPRDLVSGPSISEKSLRQIEIERASPERVRREIGEPNQIIRGADTEQWIFVSLFRAVSVNRVLFVKKVSCQFQRITDAVTFQGGRVVKVNTESKVWYVTDEEDKDCHE